MKFNRYAKVQWTGPIKEGKGKITTESKALDEQVYGFGTRFEDENGTNPEELVGAAHAACYSMQLSAFMGEEDLTPDSIDTKATVYFEDKEIPRIHLDVTVKAKGLTEEKMHELTKKAKENCPLSKLLKAAEITLEARMG